MNDYTRNGYVRRTIGTTERERQNASIPEGGYGPPPGEGYYYDPIAKTWNKVLPVETSAPSSAPSFGVESPEEQRARLREEAAAHADLARSGGGYGGGYARTPRSALNPIAGPVDSLLAPAPGPSNSSAQAGRDAARAQASAAIIRGGAKKEGPPYLEIGAVALGAVILLALR